MTDPLDLIEKGCYLCLRFMLKPSTRTTGCIEVTVDGYYVLSSQAHVYHPLEAVLVGEPVQSHDWKADVAARLCVGAAWVEGFMDCLASSSESSTDNDYIQG